MAWYSDLPHDRTLYGTPLVVDGIMYYEGSYNVLRAVNAVTGEQLWEYDPRVIEHAGDRLRIMWDASRGIAFYEGRVYLATGDGRLIAVEAATGREVWSTLTVDPDLRASSLVLSRSTFEDVVVRGSLRANGMSNFPNLSPDEVENIRHYIRSMASPLRE